MDLSIAVRDLAITDGDLTNVVEDLAFKGTSLPFSRLLSLFLNATLSNFAGAILLFGRHFTL